LVPFDSPGEVHKKGDAMPEVEETVTLHPETVQQAEKIAKKTSKRRSAAKKTQPKSQKAAAPVTIRYSKRPDFLNKEAWNRALLLAGGDVKRLVVESPTSVLVKNR